MPGWFPYEVDVTDSSEIRDLADILGILPVYARGHLADLRCYIFKQFQLGVIQGRNLEAKISEGASWVGDPIQFISALIETRLLHRTEDASPDYCSECFPPKEDGSPYTLVPGAYVLHGWASLIENYLEWIERKKIKKEQDAKRQRDKYHRDNDKKKGTAQSTLSVHERPRTEYVPQRRGLRAAPRIIRDRFTHALESVTSRENLREAHADLTLTSQTAFRPNVPTMPQKPIPTPPPTPQNPATPSTNLIENDPDSLISDLTQTSRSPHAEKSVTSPETDRQTEKHQEYPVSLSLKDRESLTGGAAKKIAVATHADCKFLFKTRYKEQTNEELSEKLSGFLDKIIARLHKRPDKFGYDEIGRRAEFWFRSSWSVVRKEWGYRPGEFEKQFDLLREGPLEQHSKRRTTKHGQSDKPADRFTTVDDF